MSQKLPVNDSKCVEYISIFNEYFMKGYNDESDEGYFLEVDVQYSENLHKLHNDLAFLPESFKKIEKPGKPAANFHDKEDYVKHIKTLKKELKYGLVLKKVHKLVNLIKSLVLG